MQFYRRLSTIKAISFDLDDTLYNNRPIMLAIEKKMCAHFVALFATKLPELNPSTNLNFNRQFWAPFRAQATQAQPDIHHDVVQHRFESYRLGMIAHGLSNEVAQTLAQAALDYFIALRSDFVVPKASHELLARLAKKYPLASISNGNVDTKALGIDHYFSHIYHAGYQVVHQADSDKENALGVVGGKPNVPLFKHKPDTDMFHDVCTKLNIQPHELLHVGDCGLADIHGALTAGCQAAWLPQYGVGKTLKQLPHIELKSVNELLGLLKN